jgi:hypothetical protein
MGNEESARCPNGRACLGRHRRSGGASALVAGPGSAPATAGTTISLSKRPRQTPRSDAVSRHERRATARRQLRLRRRSDTTVALYALGTDRSRSLRSDDFMCTQYTRLHPYPRHTIPPGPRTAIALAPSEINSPDSSLGAVIATAWRPYRTWATVHLRALRERRTQRERNCVGGCPIGSLASELSDTDEIPQPAIVGNGAARPGGTPHNRRHRHRRSVPGGTTATGGTVGEKARTGDRQRLATRHADRPAPDLPPPSSPKRALRWRAWTSLSSGP